MKEEDYPEKVKELIGENKAKEFQMTYQDAGYLYLMKGYGEQKTGGYSIQIEDLSLWDNAIHLADDVAWSAGWRRTEGGSILSLSGD